MRFRPATEHDAPLLAPLNKQLIEDEGHRNPTTVADLEERMRTWLAGGGYEAVIFDGERVGEELLGYALYRREPDHVYLRQFFVCREHRRRGVGRAAMRWLVEHPWAGVPRVRLDVLVGNEAAIAFYRATGFADYCLTMEFERQT